MKKLTYSLLISLFIFTGCGNQNDVSDETTIPKPPGVSLQIAAIQGNVTAVKQHISAGSDIDMKDEYGSTPLIIAATFGKTEVAKSLIDAGADLGITNNDGSTPLHIAAFLCRTDIVKALLAKGADKTAKNNFGRIALDSVSGSFDEAKVIYDLLLKDLKPLGFTLDYEYLKQTRPEIADLLQ